MEAPRLAALSGEGEHQGVPEAPVGPRHDGLEEVPEVRRAQPLPLERTRHAPGLVRRPVGAGGDAADRGGIEGRGVGRRLRADLDLGLARGPGRARHPQVGRGYPGTPRHLHAGEAQAHRLVETAAVGVERRGAGDEHAAGELLDVVLGGGDGRVHAAAQARVGEVHGARVVAHLEHRRVPRAPVVRPGAARAAALEQEGHRVAAAPVAPIDHLLDEAREVRGLLLLVREVPVARGPGHARCGAVAPADVVVLDDERIGVPGVLGAHDDAGGAGRGRRGHELDDGVTDPRPARDLHVGEAQPDPLGEIEHGRGDVDRLVGELDGVVVGARERHAQRDALAGGVLADVLVRVDRGLQDRPAAAVAVERADADVDPLGALEDLHHRLLDPRDAPVGGAVVLLHRARVVEHEHHVRGEVGVPGAGEEDLRVVRRGERRAQQEGDEERRPERGAESLHGLGPGCGRDHRTAGTR